MKTLDELTLQAGGYSATDLMHASSLERRQIVQLGRASLFSILAGATSVGIAVTHFSPSQNSLTQALVLIAAIFFTILVIFQLNRTIYHTSDLMGQDEPDIALPALRGLLILFTTLMCYIAFAGENPLTQLVPFMLAILEAYPLLLKKRIGQTIAGAREQARLSREYKRSALKHDEYDHQIKHSKVVQILKADEEDDTCPRQKNFDPVVCQEYILAQKTAIGCIRCPNYEDVRAIR